ncbi:hypothetical protein E4U41_005881 [Claviceps citrina]|nr:hypothetical protein E4U41_005881 [Claviceps citrina]
MGTDESPLHYEPGGYHPVALGDTFKNNRYRIVHKLGWGGYAVVWAARDNILETWVAIKIQRAECGHPSAELLKLEWISQLCGSEYMGRFLDSFVHVGPYGHHQCIVTELLGPSLKMVIDHYARSQDDEDEEPYRLNEDAALRITKKLLRAVSSFHEAGFAHGDLSGANVVFTVSGIGSLSEDELLHLMEPPETNESIRQGGIDEIPVSTPLVRTADWYEWIDDDREDIRVIDWGEAFKHGQVPDRLNQPKVLRAPETMFAGPFDHRVDLWRAGIIIYMLVFGACPFVYTYDDAGLIDQMVGFIEELPQQWTQEWKDMQEKSKDDRPTMDPEKWKKDCLPYTCKLEEKFHKEAPPDLMPLLPVIRGLMRFLPSDRLSAAEALQLID